MGRKLTTEALSKRLGADISVEPHHISGWMLGTTSKFPDGDSCPIHIQKIDDAKLRLTDHGHMLMRISYERDIDDVLEGNSGELLESIMKDAGLKWDGSAFCLDTDLTQLRKAVRTFGEAMLKVNELR